MVTIGETLQVVWSDFDESWIVETTIQEVGNIRGFEEKEDAVDRARSIAGEEGDQLVIENKDGSVQDIHSY